jgi:hypothetical protein
MSTIYGIFSNDEIKNYDSLNNAFNAGAIYSSVCNSKKNERQYEYIYEIQFFKNITEPINLTYGNWKLSSKKLVFNVFLGRNYVQKIEVIDKFGQIDNISTSEYQLIDIVRDINISLKELSSFNSWDEYKLITEINTLKSEIEKLKSQTN